MDEAKSQEPIAIIGMGCRMPGDIRSPSDLWEALMSEKIANTSKVPSSRFDIDAYLHPSSNRPGSFNVSGGYFLEGDTAAFDPGFFNISPVEALWMDPQQRKLLEVAYEALESSGTSLESISGARIGCFVGSFTTDFQQMMLKEPDFRHAYAATGIDTGILGIRINHVFNLTGPCLMMNTACSSSLAALDAACNSISMGQCDGAIVGGTNLILTVEQQMNTAMLGVLSPSNQSHTFDESADGYGRAEGVGALYLKPLSAALQNGDPVRAVIRSTASGSNGRSLEALTHPSIKGQTEVLIAAHQLAGLDTRDTDYIECHGTGTPIGDPIEVKAIHQALGSAEGRTGPILIGSIKPNIGHSEAASSIGTIIKAVLALENGIIPPTTGVTKLNPQIPWDDLNVKVVTQPMPLPESTRPRRIGVSAFGYGGTNSHAVLEEFGLGSPGRPRHKGIRTLQGVSRPLDGADSYDDGRSHLLLISAHDEATLRNNIQDLLSTAQTANLLDLAYTLGVRRTKLPERAFIVAHKDRTKVEIRIENTRISSPKNPPVIGLVFTGQGAQWPGMGAGLLKAFPSMLQNIQKLDRHLKSLALPPDWDLATIMTSTTSAELYDQAEYAQPLCTAVQIILVDLLYRWGLRPAAFVGHSSGEIGAAYAAGLLSSESAIAAAYYRGKVAASIKEDGAMLAAGMSASEAEEYVLEDSVAGKVTVACHNSPKSCTLSGDREAIDRIKARLESQSVFARILKTGGKAYHSHHMKGASTIYNDYMEAEKVFVESQRPTLATRMFSTSHLGQVYDQDGSIPHTYWADNLCNPVLFDEAVNLMLQEAPGINTLIEVGPHSALAGPLKHICLAASRQDIHYCPTLERRHDDVDQLLRLAGELWLRDAALDVRTITNTERATEQGHVEEITGALLVDLPTYHWTYTKSYWSEPRLVKEQRNVKEPRHDILGRRLAGVSPLEPVWRNILRQRDLPWLGQHRIGGEVMLPAAGYLALAIEAVTQIHDEQADAPSIQSYTLRDVVILSATVVPDDDIGTETMFHLRRVEGGGQGCVGGSAGQWYQFTTSCCSYGTWKETARGRVCVDVRDHCLERRSHSLPQTPVRHDSRDWQGKLRAVGFDLGPAFCNSQFIYSSETAHVASADMTISRECGLMYYESRYVLHPGVLDSCLQPTQVAIHHGNLDDLDCGTIPVSFQQVTVFPPRAEQMTSGCTLQTWTPGLGNRSYTSGVQLLGPDGALLVAIEGYRHVMYPSAIPKSPQSHPQRDLYLRTDWKVDTDYIDWATHKISTLGIEALVDLFFHKDVTSRTLCLDPSLAAQLLSLRSTLPLSIVASSENAQSPAMGQEVVDLGPDYSKSQDYRASYDLIVGCSISDTKPATLESLRVMMSPVGKMILPVDASDSPDQLQVSLVRAGFSGIDVALPSGHVITTAGKARAIAEDIDHNGERRMLVLYRQKPTSLLTELSKRLAHDEWDVRAQSIRTAVTLRPNEQVILLADVEGSFLANLIPCELQVLKQLTEAAKHFIWVTCGGLLTGDKPEYGMAEGAARTIRREKGTLDLVTVDFDSEGTANGRVIDLVADIAHRQNINGCNGETEYYVQSGVPHVGRLVSYHALHQQFVPDSGEVAVLPWNDSLPVAAHRSAQGELEFHRIAGDGDESPLRAGEVEIRVEAIGLNAMDLPDDRDFLNHQVAGTVTRVGGDVHQGLVPGSKVVGFALGKLGTFQRTSHLLVQAMEPSADLVHASTLPCALTTAMFGLDELARIQPGDNVVIVDGMGDIGLAAVEICRLRAANAIIVTTSQATQDLLIRDASTAVPRENIIQGQGGGVAARIQEVTGGGGADVVFCATPPQEDFGVSHECFQSLAEFARVVVLSGVRGSSAMPSSPFAPQKSVSVLQFRLTDVLEKRPQSVARILKQCVDLYQTGSISLLGTANTQGPAELEMLLPQAARLDMGSGRTVLVYDNHASFRLKSSPKTLFFNPNATYLLVGCLGGVGRQVALWMAERGARHIAFVSRTGTAKQAARETVQTLRSCGVDVSVLHADVTVSHALKDAVAKIDPAFPVRGVLNAATTIMDSVFSNMTFDQWQSVIDSKVKGCWNLHELFKAEGELDFFVMTSSVASILGSAGQCNYGAANSFLDSLARHRRYCGLPAVSLVLPAIFGLGYVQEHSLEQAILSKGMYGIYEKEMLKAFEVCMTPQRLLPPELDHLIVGLQPRRFGSQIRASGAHMPQDPRLNWLKSAMEEQVESDCTQGGHGTFDPNSQSVTHESILRAVKDEPDTERAIEAVAVFTARRLARVLMLEEDQVQMRQRSIASHGLDSMIGTEFRNWIFREFGVDIPFQQLLAGNLTVHDLAKLLCEKLLEKHSTVKS